MATARQVLTNTFNVKAITPYDPGIQALAAIRTGVYPGIGPVTISPLEQTKQLLGLAPDPLAAAARSGVLDKSSGFLDTTLPQILIGTTAAVTGFGIGGALGTGLGGLVKGAGMLTAQPTTGGKPMAFQDGDSGYFGMADVFGGFNQALQGGLGNALLNIGTQAASGYLANQFGSPGQGITSMAAVPAVVGAGRAIATVGRGFFTRFPNLATAIQGMRNAGQNVTRANLYSLMRRFGPEFLVTGGILTAAAVSELAIAGPGRRRMNPGNVKALRRAHRRMKSFHHVCVTNDRLLGGRRKSTKRGAFGGTTITQVK